MRKLKLAEGRDVPMEDGRPWPAEGAEVEETLYIRRRLRDGDLVEAADEAASESEQQQTTDTGRKGRKGDR